MPNIRNITLVSNNLSGPVPASWALDAAGRAHFPNLQSLYVQPGAPLPYCSSSERTPLAFNTIMCLLLLVRWMLCVLYREDYDRQGKGVLCCPRWINCLLYREEYDRQGKGSAMTSMADGATLNSSVLQESYTIR